MKRIVQNKISRKFFFVLLVISFSALSSLSIFQAITTYDEGLKDAYRYQKEYLNFLSNEVSNRLIIIERMMQLSSHSKGVLEEGVNERFRFYLWKILKHNPSVFEVSAIDKNGKEIILASKIRTETVGDLKDVSQEQYFKEVISGKTHYSKIQHYYDNTKPYMIIAIPVFKFDGTINSVLVSKFWLSDIQKILLSNAFGKTGYAFITDNHMEIIAHPQYEKVFKHTNIKYEYNGIEKAIEESLKKKGIHQHGMFEDSRGEKFICTSVYIPEFDWVLSVAQSKKEIFSVTYRIILSYLFVSGVLFILVFIVSKKISENITKPIIKLKDLTASIAEGNFNEKMIVKTNDEIEELANNFNQMSEKLKNIYLDLENKVEERTKELLLLYSFTSAVSKSLYVSETARTAGDELVAVLELDGFIFVSNENGELNMNNLVSSIINEDDIREIIEILIKKGIIQYISKHHIPYCLKLEDEAISVTGKKVIDINSIAVFPILYQGNIMGYFILFSELKDAFNSNIISAIETCMIQLGVSLANAQRYEITEELSFKDPLTKLFNRRYFETKLENEFARCMRYGRESSVCMIDIDHFKKINDTYGHQSGDAILRQLAEIIQSSIRKSDVAARYGGEEFIILMTESSPDKAYIAAERIRKKVEEHAFVIDVDPGYIHITVSIGIAGFVSYMATKEDLVEQADRALYSAKQTGRNKVCM